MVLGDRISGTLELMLAVSPLRNPKNEREVEMEGFTIEDSEFLDFSGGNLLDSIDFDDLFLGISDGDVLPDLEMDPEILAEFSASVSEESDVKSPPSPPPEKKQHVAAAASSSDVVSTTSSPVAGEETVSTRDELVGIKEADKGRKSMSSHSKNPPGKRKVKVTVINI